MLLTGSISGLVHISIHAVRVKPVDGDSLARCSGSFTKEWSVGYRCVRGAIHQTDRVLQILHWTGNCKLLYKHCL